MPIVASWLSACGGISSMNRPTVTMPPLSRLIFADPFSGPLPAGAGTTSRSPESPPV
jgi:hypothetical protein